MGAVIVMLAVFDIQDIDSRNGLSIPVNELQPSVTPRQSSTTCTSHLPYVRVTESLLVPGSSPQEREDTHQSLMRKEV